MVTTIIEIILVVIMLIGIVHQDKLIAFEHRMEDKLAERIAKVIVKRRAER